MFFKSAVLASLASSALAGIFITSPTASSTFTGGQKATIAWQEDNKAPLLPAWGLAKVSIYTGNAIQQTSLQTIAESVNVSAINTIEFVPSATIGPNSKNYFVRIESLSLMDSTTGGKYPQLAFSAMYQMSGMSGTFSPAVQAQIDGQSTAPVGGATSGSATATSQSASTTPKTSASGTATKNAAAASTTTSNAATSAKISMGNLHVWVGVLGGIAAGAMVL